LAFINIERLGFGGSKILYSHFAFFVKLSSVPVRTV
jgi:hypothetical protein